MTKYHLMTGGRYPVLRSLALIYLIVAGVVCALGIIAATWIMIELGDRTIGQRLMLSISALALTFFSVVTVLAMVEGIKLFMDMAVSLRLMAQHMASNAPIPTMSDGGRNRLDLLDDETAEAALIKGH